jgi:inorganic triphosphatase YgiF
MDVETELKFRAPGHELQNLALGQVPGGLTGERAESDVISTYFDTAKQKLRRHGLSLRVRQVGDKRIQTIKSTSRAQFGRGEWETEIEGDTPDLKKVGGTPVQRFASKKFRRKLRPIFQTRVHRTTLPVHTRRSEIELAVDLGKIVAGRRSTRIEEFELELSKGKPEDLFHYAKAIERSAQAELYLRTKFERGYALVDGDDELAHYAEPVELEKNMEVNDAFRLIARAAVRHFSANADAVQNLDPEGVHQMRVGLRRLRAAISLFSGMLSGSQTEEIKAELKWLTNELAPAREIDVFVKEKIHRAAQKMVPRRGGKALEEEFVARREEALERARRATCSERYRALLVDLLEWIEVKHSSSQKEANISIGKFAPKLLRRRIKKIIKAGRDLKALSVQQRHKFRIKIKKIRYAAEFFESLFPGKGDQKRLARLSKRLKIIQDALGSLNDFIAHQKLATEVALKTSAQDRRARAFAAGVILGREDGALKPLMKTAVKEVTALRRINPFW